MGDTFIFKRRKIDKQILAGWVLAFILPIPWAIFSLVGLITHPAEIPYFVFLIITPITLLLLALTLIMLLRLSTTVYTIDEEKIVKRAFLFKKEILWSSIADVQYNTMSVNGIQTAKTLSLKNLKGKILLAFPCPPEKSFIGKGNLVEILLAIFNSHGQQRAVAIKKDIADLEVARQEGSTVYQLNSFVKMFLHLILIFVLLGLLTNLLTEKHKVGEVLWSIFLFAAITYLGLINFNSRYEIQKDSLKYKNIFQKEISISWGSISHIVHNTGITNNIILETPLGKLKLRGIVLVNGNKLANEISQRCRMEGRKEQVKT